jgi:hypothetical protein
MPVSITDIRLAAANGIGRDIMLVALVTAHWLT